MCALLTFAGAAGAWGVGAAAADPAAAGASAGAGVEGLRRASGLARFRPLLAAPVRPSVRLELGGSVVTVRAAGEATVGELLRSLGVALGPADRLSVPADTTVVAGLRVAVDRGLPVTLVDAGQPAQLRAPRGTVGEVLAANGISLGPLDRLEPAADVPVAPGSIVRLTRVTDREVWAVEAVPYAVRRIADPTLEVGQQHVEAAGVPGEALRVHTVRSIDGQEAARTVARETILRESVTAVLRVGVRPRPAPPAPAEIERIVRAAAAKWSADAEQLLRVAWCESRYDPSAYNPGNSDSGLFQFIPATWARNAPRAGYAGASPFDPVASANTAAMLFAEGRAHLWTCR